MRFSKKIRQNQKMKRKRIKEIKGQVGMEYMMIMGFVTLAIMSILAFAVFYSDQIKDRIKLNQVEGFAIQLISSAESVFFAGTPSKTTVSLYLPEGVEQITVAADYIVFDVRTSSGINTRVFNSKVPLTGAIPITEGLKKISLEAQSTSLFIS